MRIYGLISSYRDGELTHGAIQSAVRACDRVLVYEGPVGDAPETGEPTGFRFWRSNPHVLVCEQKFPWESDASKRQNLLEHAHTWANGEPAWVVWVDSDELLLWPEQLRDTLAAVPGDAFNWPIRLVQLDSRVTEKCSGKVLRLELVERCLQSSYQWLLANGMQVALPNVPDDQPPLQGEPHILHRSCLRARSRTVERLHVAEASWFKEQTG